MKFAIISPSFSPSDAGQSIVLNRLLKTFNPKEYCLVASHYYSRFKDQSINKKIYFPPSLPLKIQRWLIQMHLEAQYIRLRARQFKKILEKENCTHLINCTSDLFATRASLIAAKDLNIPFILYSFDDYTNQWAFDRVYFKFACETEKDVFENSDKIIVPNEFLQKEYRKKFGIESEIIRNPVDTDLFSVTCIKPNNEKIVIVYAGSIYDVHFDAFKALIQALDQIKNSELHIYSNQSIEILSNEGISGPHVKYYNAVPYDNIPNIYACSDILYLPLAFNSPYPETTIRTSSPGKMGEYLASGRPVLVHAPDYSYIAWYFRKNKCGIVVDKLLPNQIFNGISELLNNPEYTKSNKELAKTFDIQTQQCKLREILKKTAY